MKNKEKLQQLKNELDSKKHGYVEVYQDGKLVNIWEKEEEVYLQLLGFLYNKYVLKLNINYKIKIKNINDNFIKIIVKNVESFGEYCFVFNNIPVNYQYLNFIEIDKRLNNEK